MKYESALMTRAFIRIEEIEQAEYFEKPRNTLPACGTGKLPEIRELLLTGFRKY